jgi:hypothetical protein
MATVAKQQFVPRASSAAVDKIDKLTPADGLLQVTQHTEIATMCLLAPEVGLGCEVGRAADFGSAGWTGFESPNTHHIFFSNPI